MRVLCIDASSNCLDWLMRCQRWGHDIRWWDRRRDNGEPRLAGRGIIDKITVFSEIQRKWLDWADLIYLPDNAHYQDLLEPYREAGYPIIGANAAAAEMELDRGHGQALMKKYGIPIMESQEFHDYKAAMAFVQRNPEFLVSKPSGDANKALSYVAHDPGDMVYMLERWSKRPDLQQLARTEGFILQEKKKGIEMAAGAYYGPGGFVGRVCENWENKKLMVGDLGVATGEMGTVAMYVKRSKLAERVLFPIAPYLKKIGYVGYIDNNCIIDPKTGDPWPLEWTMRDGWPLRHNLQALHDGDPARWMADLIEGLDTVEAKMDTVCVSVVCAIPDFPYSKLTNKETRGVPLYNANDIDHLHWSEVMMQDDVPVFVGDKVVRMPHPVTSGDYVFVATGTGETITAARASVYAAVDRVHVPNSLFYRTDIGRGRLVKQIPQLHALGYGKGLRL